MPYSVEISRENRALFVLLMDQSYSMEDALGGGSKKKMDELATVVNRQLDIMAKRATGGEGIKDWMDIGFIGYRTDQDAVPIIESPLVGDALGGKMLASITEIADNIGRMEQRTREYYDEEAGETLTQDVQFPVWVDAIAEGGTPMCTALNTAYEMVKNWIEDGHQGSFPPIVIHFTDGENQEDGNPLDYAEPLKGLETNDGNVLLFNCHLSEAKADEFFFPHSGEILPNDYARSLFDMSSVLPDPIFDRARSEGFEVEPGARGMVFNADMTALIKFLDMGTRVATLR